MAAGAHPYGPATAQQGGDPAHGAAAAAGAHGIEAAVRTGCTYASINALLKQLHDERVERTSVASAHTPPPS